MAGSEAKAELRNAVIRSYIRLGFVAVGFEDLLAADGEEDVVTAEPEALVLTRSGVPGCRTEGDIVPFLTIVPFRCGTVVAEGLME